MDQKTYVAKFTDKTGTPWQILTVVYPSGGIHQAVRHNDWDTWSAPLYPIDPDAPVPA